jgi:hypothetical protein
MPITVQEERFRMQQWKVNPTDRRTLYLRSRIRLEDLDTRLLRHLTRYLNHCLHHVGICRL